MRYVSNSKFFLHGVLLCIPLFCGCGRIDFEELDSSDSTSPTDSGTGGDSGTSGDDTETATVTDSDGMFDSSSDSQLPDTSTGTGTDTANDTGTSTANDTGTSTVNDTGTGTVNDTGTLPDTDTLTDTNTDSATDSVSDQCASLPAGDRLLGDTDAPDYDWFGNMQIAYQPVSGASFTDAWHVSTGADLDDSTSAQLVKVTQKDILAGDNLLAEFYARCIDAASGECALGMLFEEYSSPWTRAVEYYIHPLANWEFYQVAFTASIDFAASGAHYSFRLGYPNQTIELMPAGLINYGATTPLSCLPDNSTLHSGVEIVSSPPTEVIAGFEYLYRIEVNSHPAASIIVSGLPAWMTVDPVRMTITGSPQAADEGTTSPILLEANGDNGSDSQTWQVTVIRETQLVAHFPLDESAGATVPDISGNSYDGTLTGDINWLPTGGRLAGGLLLDAYTGALDYVELPNATALDDLQDGSYTISAWVQPNSVPPGTNVTDNDYGYAVVMKPGRHTGLWYNHNQQFLATHHFVSNPIEITSSACAPGTFYHVAEVFNVDQHTLTLYVQGEFAAGISYTASEAFFDFGTAQWIMGVANPAASTYALAGDLVLDDVRMYSRALTPHEVKSLFIQGN